MLKLSAPDWCFFKKGMDPGAYYQKLKQIGYSGVEMVDPSRWQAARAAGLKIINISANHIERGLNRPINHPQLLAKIRGIIDLAAENNIPHVIVGGVRASAAHFGKQGA